MTVAVGILNTLAETLAAAWSDRSRLSLPAAPLGGVALTTLAAARARNRPILLVTEGQQALDILYRDLLTLREIEACLDIPLISYPPTDAANVARKPGSPNTSPDTDGARLNALLTLAHHTHATEAGQPESHAPILVTCIQALLQKVPDPAALAGLCIALAPGLSIERDELTDKLLAAGYEFQPEVVEKGQAAVRGGILDIWPVTEPAPLRVELFGNTIESLRTFDPADQKSTGRVPGARLTPCQSGAAPGAPLPCLLSDYLPDGSAVLWHDLPAIEEHAAIQTALVEETGQTDAHVELAVFRDALDARPAVATLAWSSLANPASESANLPALRFDYNAEALQLPPTAFRPDLQVEARKRTLERLIALAEAGWRAFVFLDTAGALDHFQTSVLGPANSPVTALVGPLSEGFTSATLQCIVVCESEFYGRRKIATPRSDSRRTYSQGADTRVTDLTDIEPGDYVVHMEHGIGRYMGLHEIEFNGQRQEVLTIEYADNTKLHVPTTHCHLLSRYVGMSRRFPKPHRLGGRQWLVDKAAAERAIADMAASLLETQALRDLKAGFAFPPDSPWQHEFEASFPYRETPDQEQAVRAVKTDMEQARPLDRLVCGDAGYGKTEVAIRAAFKAVMAQRQVAVLVPTTILAQQHFETFTERMAAYPVRIEMLSRFRARSARTGVLAGLRDGTVDIVIGTHALVQPSVTFKDLGLVIIDEEQRFGVEHKERFKHMRTLVDVLTLTATPIPRTLYMSLMGARDMSLIQTPPRERVPIETLVTRGTDAVIREAILRELSRDGQVFYLHNRVLTIDLIRQRLQQVVPEARIGVAHGQMAAGQLAAVMHDFTAGRFHVLLCTTIIESGTDIPRANTILIDRADRFGLADLYQLRGRVGRASRKGYAYLLLPSHGHIDSIARKRIAAVQKYSGLSAGFNLALRDLEIRGAGNLLGSAQSGHITAIGFGLYCQLLRRTVAHMKGAKPPPLIETELKLDFISLSPNDTDSPNSAIIPYSYIEDERLRIAAYRRIAECALPKDIRAVRSEFEDRFGRIPTPVERLIKMAAIRIAAHNQAIRSVETRENKVMLTQRSDYLMRDKHFPRLTDARPDEQLDQLLRLVQTVKRWANS